jgi:hypothetical protein
MMVHFANASETYGWKYQTAIAEWTLTKFPDIHSEWKIPVHQCKKHAALCCTHNISGGICDLCPIPVVVISNTYCNHKYCTFTVTSTLTYILLLTQGLLDHRVEDNTVTPQTAYCNKQCKLSLILTADILNNDGHALA